MTHTLNNFLLSTVPMQTDGNTECVNKGEWLMELGEASFMFKRHSYFRLLIHMRIYLLYWVLTGSSNVFPTSPPCSERSDRSTFKLRLLFDISAAAIWYRFHQVQNLFTLCCLCLSKQWNKSCMKSNTYIKYFTFLLLQCKIFLKKKKL